MKCSQLITFLSKTIEDYGDLDVIIDNYDNVYISDIENTRVNQLVAGGELFASLTCSYTENTFID